MSDSSSEYSSHTEASTENEELTPEALESAIRSLESHVDDVNASAEALLDDKGYTNSGIGFRHAEENESTLYSGEAEARVSEELDSTSIHNALSETTSETVTENNDEVAEREASDSPASDTTPDAADQNTTSSETVASTDGESVAKKSVDDEWGFSSGRKGMARETKIGLALILLLMCAFGFVVYRKVQQQQESLLNINSIVKQEKTQKEDGDKPVRPKGAPTEPSTLPPNQGEPTAEKRSPIRPVGFDGTGGSGVTTLDNNGFGSTTNSAGTGTGATPATPGSNPFLLEQPGPTGTGSSGTGTGVTQLDGSGTGDTFDPFGPRSDQPTTPTARPTQAVTLDGSDPNNIENPFSVATNANPATEVNPSQQTFDAFQAPIERTAGKVEQPANSGTEVVATGASTDVHGLFDGPGLGTQQATLEVPVTNTTPSGNVNAIDANGFEQPTGFEQPNGFQQQSGFQQPGTPLQLAQNDPNQLQFDDGSTTGTGNTQPATNNASSTAELDALLNANRAGDSAGGTAQPNNTGIAEAGPFDAIDNVRTTELPVTEPPRTAANLPTDNPFSGTGIRPVPQPLDPNRSASPPFTGLGGTASPTAAIDPNDRPRVHTVQPGENYWSISRKFYGTPRFNLALAASNSQRIPDPRKMRPGMKVLIPSVGAMRATYPKLCPKDLVAGEVAKAGQKEGFSIDRSGNAWFVVGSDDTLGSIAHQHLGRASRWIQIYQLNRQSVPDPNKLRIGTKLRLPSDASDVRIAREPRTIR